MTCEIVAVTFVLSQICYGTSWKELSALNDPPGRPSVRAATVATQGMSKPEIQQRLALLLHAKRIGAKHASPEQIAVLNREIGLFQVALENK